MNRQRFTILGVASQNFRGAEMSIPEVWIPVTMQPAVMLALLACYIPARRATKVDPLVALRNE